MPSELNPDQIINKFILPKGIENGESNHKELEYAGAKYLAVLIMGDKISIRIDGRPIIEYDSCSNEVLKCTDIDESSVYVTNRIECRYNLDGGWNYSC